MRVAIDFVHHASHEAFFGVLLDGSRLLAPQHLPHGLLAYPRSRPRRLLFKRAVR